MDDLVFLVSSKAEFATHVVSKHLIGYATIQFMDRGRLFLQYDERRYTLEGRWFWPAYPGPYTVFHRAEGCDSWSHRHLAFQGPLWSHWVSNGLWPTEPQEAPAGRDWAAYFDEMSLLAAIPTRWGRLRALNMLEGLLLELAEARQTPPVSEPWLDRVLALLDEDIPDYGRIADEQGVAVSTLRRRFFNATGTPLHQHALLTKIARARTLLIETDLPLKAIADQLGYSNVYFFSRQFKKFIGVPPGTFRNSR